MTNPSNIYNQHHNSTLKISNDQLINIPEEIRGIPNWALWRHEGRQKVPYQINGNKASSTNPETWSTFHEALAAYNSGNYDGLVWALPLDRDTRYWGIDADDAIDPTTGQFNQWAAPVQPRDLIALSSYTEITPSCAGFRVLVKCNIDVPGKHKREYGEKNPTTKKTPGVEMYSTGRFFTVTGNHLPGTPGTVEERTDEVLALYKQVFGPSKSSHQQLRTVTRSEGPTVAPDSEINHLVSDLFDGRVGPRHDLIFATCGVLVLCGWDRANINTLLGLLIHLFGADDPSYNVDSALTTAARNLEECLKKHKTKEDIAGWTALGKCLDQITFDNVKATLTDDYTHSDTGNGRRLVDKHRDTIRYCVDEQRWYVWSGSRWNKQEVQLQHMAKGIDSDIRATADKIEKPAATGDDAVDEKAMARYEAKVAKALHWANQSGNLTRINAAIKCASTDKRVWCRKSDFDSHPDLLNCANGIVNLRTGELMEHDRDLMLSYLCPTEYHPGARHDVFDNSLAAFTRNHADLLPFLQTLIGYTIQGTKSAEKIVILHGLGNAGKGTFMDWLTFALGADYSCAMSYNSVRKQDRNAASASSDIARLEGKRLVVVSEIEKGSKLSESFMKEASGNDSIVARKQYEGEREFRPTHQFIFQTNYRPGFDSLDPGNRRRYIEIPFDNDLRKDSLVKFDGNLKHKMRQDKHFLEAVLSWAVAGSQTFFVDGLNLPASVIEATAKLFEDNDFLADFIADRCLRNPHEKVSTKEMWKSYCDWCEEQGEQPASGRNFNRMLEERGFWRGTVNIGGFVCKGWRGVRVKKPHEYLISSDSAGNDCSHALVN